MFLELNGVRVVQEEIQGEVVKGNRIWRGGSGQVMRGFFQYVDVFIFDIGEVILEKELRVVENSFI